ncbi:Glucose-repressible protein [Cyphellophora attinorum]|uniref:Glucose-repressible protein n=1 Tax=Cyphellophora attinorum TaxID=1664694 RepID=A0A0N0NNA1_9EURO|nr:Glucose-repressible protein [Phialophora attinorum]KPI41381.1 Glucose-repressible protein [Phialophora attinorum]
METVKNAANYVGDKVNEATATASKETNKEVAKDSNADISTRATAAKDAVGDKFTESKNSASAEGNKQAAKH